jgi:hypothetical protein|tara:strand:- start:502 stop:606 length:105 start_codon:yes stop_codon:yes gene_type:complete
MLEFVSEPCHHVMEPVGLGLGVVARLTLGIEVGS